MGIKKLFTFLFRGLYALYFAAKSNGQIDQNTEGVAQNKRDDTDNRFVFNPFSAFKRINQHFVVAGYSGGQAVGQTTKSFYTTHGLCVI